MISRSTKMLLHKQHGSYGKELFDKRWREKRVEVLDRDNNSCRVCNSKENLEVHHRQYHYSLKLRKYRKPWEYSNQLLLTLCKKCHQKGHQKYKVPTKYV